MSDADLARESFRNPDGTFGEQPEHGEQECALSSITDPIGPNSDLWIQGFNDSFCGAWVDGYNTGWNEDLNGNDEYGEGFNAGSDARDDAKGHRYMATEPFPNRFADARAESTVGFAADFGPCHRHPYGGGWVADTADVDESVFVGSGAVVLDEAKIYEGAVINGNAIVRDYAVVTSHSEVSGNAVVKGTAAVYDRSRVRGSAVLLGAARVESQSDVDGEAVVDGGVIANDSIADGRARVHGYVGHDSFVGGDCHIERDAEVVNNATVSGCAQIRNGGRALNGAIVHGTAEIARGGRVSGAIGVSAGRISTDVEATPPYDLEDADAWRAACNDARYGFQTPLSYPSKGGPR